MKKILVLTVFLITLVACAAPTQVPPEQVVLELAKALNSLIDEGSYNLVLDLKKLEYISSAGFTVLLATVRKVREKQGDLRLASLPPIIRKIADVLGCSSIIKIFDSPKEALTSFKTESQ